MFQSIVRSPTPAARRRMRFAAAAVAAACAVVYFAIGLRLIYPGGDDPNFTFVFGMSAGLAFTLGAVLLATTEHRAVLILGALFQLFVIVMYFLVSNRRDPHFEIWGLTLKVAQAVILVGLLSLLRPFRGRAVTAAERA